VQLAADVAPGCALDLGDALVGDTAERRVTLTSASPFPVAYTLEVDELAAAGQGQQPAFYCRCARGAGCRARSQPGRP
jgi:hypothetical protein